MLESVNDALRVYNTAGNPLSDPIALNAFYNYPPAIIRATGARGPELTDPSCYYDTDTQRWFHVVLTLASDFGSTGNNSLDIAVSMTPNPLGDWKLYSIPVQNDGDVSIAGSGTCPCLGDYPHIGADRYGFYITTNAYPLGPGNFDGAQLYAISKHALAAGVDQPAIVHFGHLQVEKAGTPGFTVWPATAPAGGYADSNSGTEYFLSSMATPEALNTTGFDNRLGLRALTNTPSFDSATPNPILSSRSVDAETYGIPPLSDQKPGDFPLGQCLNADPCATRILGAPGPVKPEVEGQLDSNDTRMQQVVYVNGLVWSSLDTIVSVDGATRAGVAYFAVQPSVERAARWAAVGGGGAGLRRGGEQQRGVPGALPAAQWSRRDCDDAGRTGLLSQRGIRAYQQHCRGGCGQYRMVLASARRMGSRSTLYSMVQARIHPPRARAGVTTGRPSQTVTTSGWPPSSSGRHARSRSIRHPLLGAVAEHAPPWPIGAPISAA